MILGDLSILPRELKDLLKKYIDMPEVVEFYDRVLRFDEKDGVLGGVYPVLKDEYAPSDDKFREPRLDAIEYCESRGWNWMDYGPVILASNEEEPITFADLDCLISGIDYRVLSKDNLLKEIG